MMKKLLLGIALSLGFAAQAAEPMAVVQPAADDRTYMAQIQEVVQSVKAGHVAAVALVTTTGATAYAAAQLHPHLAYLPPVVVAGLLARAALKNDVYYQQAQKQSQADIISATSAFPLAYINKFSSCRSQAPYLIIEDFSTDRVVQPGLVIRNTQHTILSRKVDALWSELAAKMYVGSIGHTTYGQVKQCLTNTINFIHAELDDLKSYTDIESALIVRAQQAQGKQNALADPHYFRETDALLQREVFNGLDGWCAELQATHWADKLFKIRYHLTKWFGKVVSYPYYSSITYNGASRYVVELLKQLGRLQAIKAVLDRNLKYDNTQVVQQTVENR